MLRHLIKRLLMLIPVLIGISVIVFVIMHMFSPDPAPIVLGQHATEQDMLEWRKENGLSDPLLIQYWNFVQGALTGDLGTSYYTRRPVAEELFSRFPATMELAVVSIILAAVMGILLGVVSAARKNSIIDHGSMILSLVGVSMPIFWLGILLIILFSGFLHWLPSSGRMDPILQPMGGTGFFLFDTLARGDWPAFLDALQHIIMPATALSLYSTAIIARMTRSSMLETLEQDYIRTAYAKGAAEWMVIRNHALPNAMIPIVTVIGLQLGSLLSGAVLTETVFSWPGIGSYGIHCVMNSDFPVIQGFVLLVAVVVVLVNLAVDLLYTYLDPRIKFGREGDRT